MNLLAAIGIGSCLAQALNLVIIIILAGLHRKTIRLHFNRHHEFWLELIVCLISFGLGIWGFIYLLRYIP
jgi:hypothetical protein